MSDKAVQELESIKKLLIAVLLKLGASSDEIGAALGVAGARVRQIVPAAKVKKIPLLNKED